MGIKNVVSAVNAYRYNAELSAKPAVRSRADDKRSANKDKAEFSAAAKSGIRTDSVRVSGKTASAERITALKNAIADGSYSVSAEAVADAIIGL